MRTGVATRGLAVVLVLLSLAVVGCSPPQRGRVLVGRNDTDAMVAVLGTCADGAVIELTITVGGTGGETLARARTTARAVLRVGLNSPPSGWQVERWDLRDFDRFRVGAAVFNSKGLVQHYLHPAEVNLCEVRPLHAAADSDVANDC